MRAVPLGSFASAITELPSAMPISVRINSLFPLVSVNGLDITSDRLTAKIACVGFCPSVLRT
jgi:hypothetical protein